MEERLPTGAQLIRRILLHTATYSGLACGVVSLYLWGLLRLTPEQWGRFLFSVGGVFLLLFPAMLLVHRGIFERIRSSVDGLTYGTAARAQLERGFAAVCDFPRYWFAWGLLWWGGGSVVVCLAMRLQDAGFGWEPAAIVVCSTLSISFVTDMYYFFTIKPVLAPVRLALATELGEPDVRRRLIRPVGLRTKLFVAMLSTIAVSVLFAGFLAAAQVRGSLESHVLRGQNRALDTIARTISPPAPDAAPDLTDARPALEQAGADFDLLLLAPDASSVVDGPENLLPASVRAAIAAWDRKSDRGSACDAAGCWGYRRLPGASGLLVTFVPAEQLTTAAGVGRSFAALLLFSALVAAGAAFLLARDVAQATDTLRHEASRIADGDLRVTTILDSEDEFGALGHAFERMAASLRETVQRVAGAARRLQSGASEVGSAARDVEGATELQIRGTREADQAMRDIDGQIRGIATSAAELDRDVVEASSSLSELDATGAALSQSAELASRSVDEVGSSVDEMARTILQVDESSCDLARVADDTSTSLDRAASGMLQINNAAAEMSELSDRVVALSQEGRGRVRETIESMKTIADDSAAAEQAIRGLARSATEIDGIVGVIDAVASETGLLALNAAIISAQSGEHGRAFAVVADQIGDLAARVAASTRDVRDLVAKLQSRSEESADIVARGGRSVARGLELSRGAGASLEEITQTTAESAPRIDAIVAAVEDQTRAVASVTELMSRLREGAGQISRALQEQSRSTEFARSAASDIGEISKQLSRTTQEQAAGTSGIRQSAERIREAAREINAALQDQTSACCQVVSFLGELDASTRSNEQSVARLNHAAESQQRMADELQEEIAHFLL